MTRGRSPAYPYIDLGKAVETIKKIYSITRGHSVNTEDLLKKLGFSGMTGSAKKTLAALKYFGLVDQQHGSKEAKLTSRALHIIHGVEGSEEQRQAIIEAFLDPAIYNYCWSTWNGDDIADDFMRSHLILKKGFNDSTVMSFITSYKQSMRFSGIAQNGNISAGNDDQDLPKVGDFIQWDFQGAYQFPTPKKVTALVAEEGVLFVEGSQEAIPIDEVAVVDPLTPGSKGESNDGECGQTILSGDRPPKGIDMREETFALDNGDVVIRWPSKMTPESFEDFSDWLEILKRKVKRTVEKNTDQELKGEE